VLATVSNSTQTPRLPTELNASSASRFFTTGSTTGSERWRTLVTTSGGNTVVIAVPTGEVTNSLHRLTLIEIFGGAGLLAIRLGGDSQHADLATMMRRIEQESARMKVLVEDLLLLARLDQTRPIERAPVDLAVLAADACSDAVAVAPDRPVTLNAPDPVVVMG